MIYIAKEIVEILFDCAYTAVQLSMCAATPASNELFTSLSSPKIGDLVIEISTRPEKRDRYTSIGYLTKYDSEAGTGTIILFNGEVQRWSNATFRGVARKRL